MKILVQKDVFTEDTTQNTFEVICSAMPSMEVIEISDQEAMMGSERLKNHSGPFRGSLCMAQRMGRTFEYTNALNWAPAFKEVLVSNDYMFLDAGSIQHRMPREWRAPWNNNTLFIRPCSGFKQFSGNTFSTHEFKSEVDFMVKNRNIPDTIMCMLATPKNILKEWRTIFINREFVSGSQYMVESHLALGQEVPKEVIAFATSIANNAYFQNVFEFVLDIGLVKSKDNVEYLGLLEVNAFETASFYMCDLEKIYKTWEHALLRAN